MYDGAANILEPKTGVSTQINKWYHIAIDNYYICYGSNLSIRGLFRDIPFMECWYSKIIDMLQFF